MKKKSQVLADKKLLKVVVVNPPTKEQAKEKIKKISEDISYMFSSNVMEDLYEQKES